MDFMPGKNLKVKFHRKSSSNLLLIHSSLSKKHDRELIYCIYTLIHDNYDVFLVTLNSLYYAAIIAICMFLNE